MSTQPSEFVDVIDSRTSITQRVPRAWLGDPVLGRFITKTPAQRALDGELGQAPTDDSTVPEIRAFARDADIDVAGLTKKDELLAAVYAAVGTDPLPVGVNAADVDVQPSGAATEPLSSDAADGATTDPGSTPQPAETPAAGD